MFRSSPLVLLFFFALSVVHALVVPRQAAAGLPTQLTTVHNTETPLGTMIETCNVVLTPSKDAQGNDVVLEVTTCTLTMPESEGASTVPSTSAPNDSSNSGTAASQSSPTGALPAAPPASSSDTTPTSPQTSASDAPPATTPTPSPDAPPDAPSTGPSTSGIDTPPAPLPSSDPLPAPPAPTSALDLPPLPTDAGSGGSSVPAPTPTAASPASTAAVTPVASSNGPDPSGTATKDASTAPQNSALGDAAAAPTPTVAAAFVLPGKQLSVLPIGLGIFGGLSVIVLIVVAFVTYERTKYRRDFRDKQLAEAKLYSGYGANMA